MTTLIQTNKIDGLSIYGVQMVDYSLGGVHGKDFGTVTALACFVYTDAIEMEASAYADILRARQKKLNDLGAALAIIARVIGSFDNDSPKSDDTVTDDDLLVAKELLDPYSVTLNVKILDLSGLGGNRIIYIRRDDAENGRANVEYALDVEDNDMQQDMIAMQGLIGKRDNSFNTAAKIIKKVGGTGDSMLNTIGQ